MAIFFSHQREQSALHASRSRLQPRVPRRRACCEKNGGGGGVGGDDGGGSNLDNAKEHVTSGEQASGEKASV